MLDGGGGSALSPDGDIDGKNSGSEAATVCTGIWFRLQSAKQNGIALIDNDFVFVDYMVVSIMADDESRGEFENVMHISNALHLGVGQDT